MVKFASVVKKPAAEKPPMPGRMSFFPVRRKPSEPLSVIIAGPMGTTSKVECKSILTPTGGFLAGFTHSLNPYRGCTYGRSLCGVFCYAPEIRFSPSPAPWGRYLEVKTNAREIYRAEYDRLRAKSRRLAIFMSSVTDPFVPQERRFRITRSLLEEMLDRPPDQLVLQTHSPRAMDEVDVLVPLSERCSLSVQISIETDREEIAGLPKPAYTISDRLLALGRLKKSGIRSVAAVSPMLPIAEPTRFARVLDEVADFIICDHYLLGDGSPQGARTRRAKPHAPKPLPQLLVEAGFEEWTRLDTFERAVACIRRVVGHERVGVCSDGFRRAARL